MATPFRGVAFFDSSALIRFGLAQGAQQHAATHRNSVADKRETKTIFVGPSCTNFGPIGIVAITIDPVKAVRRHASRLRNVGHHKLQKYPARPSRGFMGAKRVQRKTACHTARQRLQGLELLKRSAEAKAVEKARSWPTSEPETRAEGLKRRSRKLHHERFEYPRCKISGFAASSMKEAR
jgi:hypothetical protein